MNISLKGFWLIHDLVRKTRVKVVILKRIGLPFLLPKCKKRLLYFISIILFVLMINLSQLLIWNIRIEGADFISQNQIQEVLVSKHIQVGCLVSSVHTKQLEELLREKFDTITWVSVNKEGNSLVIQIKEAPEKSEKENVFLEGSDLIADKKGIIRSVVTRAGSPQVKVGDEVSPGMILVQGEIDVLADDGSVKDKMFVRSDADIMIETVVSKTYRTGIAETLQCLSGREKRYLCLRKNGQYFMLQILKIPFEKYKATYQEKILFQSDEEQNNSLGIVTVKEVYEKKKRKEDHVCSKQLQKAQMEDIVSLKEKGIQIVVKNVNITKNRDFFVMRSKWIARGPFFHEKEVQKNVLE